MKIKSFFEYFAVQTWWVILFILVCSVLFEQGMNVRNREYVKLKEHYNELERQKKEALLLQEKLSLEINSQSDPAWVELVLMKGLGLVPEGQIKVFFDNSLKENL